MFFVIFSRYFFYLFAFMCVHFFFYFCFRFIWVIYYITLRWLKWKMLHWQLLKLKVSYFILFQLWFVCLFFSSKDVFVVLVLVKHNKPGVDGIIFHEMSWIQNSNQTNWDHTVAHLFNFNKYIHVWIYKHVNKYIYFKCNFYIYIVYINVFYFIIFIYKYLFKQEVYED